MKHLLIGFIRAWRFAISPLYGQVCRYYPSCSAYALEAVTVHGSIRDLALRTSPLPVPPVVRRRLRPGSVPRHASRPHSRPDPCNMRSL